MLQNEVCLFTAFKNTEDMNDFVQNKTVLVLCIYSESQIYEYIARVFYNVVFSTYLRSNAAQK